MFRLRIKSDVRKNKSLDKNKSVVNHVKYINREGKYRDVDNEEQLRRLENLTNTIVGQELSLPIPDKEHVIYSSPFGIIKLDRDGLHLSENASPETVAIALSISGYLYKGKIDVAGDEAFRQKVLSVATVFKYNTTFNNDNMQELFTQLKKEEENDRREWNERRRSIGNAGNGSVRLDGKSSGRKSGWKRIIQTGSQKSTLRNRSGKPNAAKHSSGASTTRRLTVPTLSSLPVVPERYRQRSGASGIMQRDGTVQRMSRVLDRGSASYGVMRWLLPERRRVEVERVTNLLITKFRNQANNDFSEGHVKYINRSEAFEVRGGCLYTSNHLPAWAENSAEKFFAAADIYERKNAERYKEIELALPNELDLETHKAIIEKFIEQHLKDYYYTYAIHDKIGALSNGERQPHVHIMFSTRKIDDVEKEHERTPEKFFARSNPDNPELGGCKKEAKWVDKYRYAYLRELREDAARIINDALEEKGIKVRVSHKSLKEQAAAAKAEGNLYLAELLSRVPEQHVDALDVLEGKAQEIKSNRRFIYDYTQSVHEKNIFRDILKYENSERQILELEEMYKSVSAQIANHELSESEKNYYDALKEELDEIVKDIYIQRQLPLWGNEIIEQSHSDFMNARERENWQEIKALGKQKKNWERFKIELESQYQDDVNVRNALEAIKKHIKDIDDTLREKAILSRRTFRRLNLDSKKEAIKIHTAQILFENDFPKKRLEKSIDKFRMEIDKLTEFSLSLNQTERTDQEEQIFSTEEIISEANRTVAEIKKDISASLKRKEYLRKKVISHARAIAMAKNVYTKGGFKKVREKIREVQKKLNNAPDEYVRIQLNKELDKLYMERQKLEDLCNKPKAQQKIYLIAAGILLKNQPSVNAYKEIENKVDGLFKELKTAKAVAVTISQKANPNVKYKIPHSSAQPISSPAILAAALSGNEKWAVLVASSPKDERFKDWKFLSELEKEELLQEMAEH